MAQTALESVAVGSVSGVAPDGVLLKLMRRSWAIGATSARRGCNAVDADEIAGWDPTPRDQLGCAIDL